MTVFVGLLRAINVGGTGKLLMTELVALCEGLGFNAVKTYIQSGNVVFESKLPAARAQAKLQAALSKKLGKEVAVTLRTAHELDAVLQRNPFKDAAPNKVVVLFANEEQPAKVLCDVEAPGGEQLEVWGRELFVHYPAGQGTSKLKIPFAKPVTGRNMNTIAKLAAMARALEQS